MKPLTPSQYRRIMSAAELLRHELALAGRAKVADTLTSMILSFNCTDLERPHAHEEEESQAEETETHARITGARSPSASRETAV